jgi:serine phosphatase RsbU (regulator of sigma subunit)
MKSATILLFLFFISCNAFAQVDSVNLLLNSSKHDTLKVNDLIKFAGRLESRGKNDEAIKAYYSASQFALKLGITKSVIKSEKSRIFLLIKTNRYEDAIKDLNVLSDYSIKNKSTIGQAHVKRLFALIDMYKGDLDVSIKKFIEAQKVWENTKDSVLIIDGIKDLGVVFYYQKDYQSAIKYWQTAINYCQFHGKISEANGMLSNLALLYVELQKYDLAENIFTSILPSAIEHNSISTVINIYTNLAALEHGRGNEDKAIFYTIKSIKALDGSGELSRQGSLYCNLGELYRLKKDFNNAKKNLFIGLDLIKESDNLSELPHAYQNLSALYLDMKSFEYALAFKDTFYAWNDSIYTLEKQEQITELEKRFNTQQKEEQIGLLNKDKLIQSAELKKQRYLIYFFIIGSLLLFVLVFFIYRSYKIKRIANVKLEFQKKEIWNQKTLIEEKNKEIIDSITYAKRIQNAMLTNDGYIYEEMKNVNAQHFILFKPKDIVSGDFYWFYKSENCLYYVTADCTGHGVPGGFMSMLGINLLNEIVIERKITSPGDILNSLREEIIKALKTDKEFTKDGMDGTICKINFDTYMLEYAAANNSFYVIRNGELLEQKAQKMPIGYMERMLPFKTNTFQLMNGDSIYTFTDGYADQFGGPKGKKFMYKNLEKILIESKDELLEVQKNILDKEFDKWKGSHEQIDDVCIIGLKI